MIVALLDSFHSVHKRSCELTWFGPRWPNVFDDERLMSHDVCPLYFN